jgi:hypothetical protein
LTILGHDVHIWKKEKKEYKDRRRALQGVDISF